MPRYTVIEVQEVTRTVRFRHEIVAATAKRAAEIFNRENDGQLAPGESHNAEEEGQMGESDFGPSGSAFLVSTDEFPGGDEDTAEQLAHERLLRDSNTTLDDDAVDIDAGGLKPA